jgi:D-3-phosphoglycerate dehydrogenase
MYVNFVNAPFVAKERGIKVVEIKSSRATDFASSITIRVKTKEGENIVEGALFGKKEPRIVRIDKFLLDAVPDGYLLLLQNEDKPGVIGNVGTLLAANNVNVARLHLGRSAEGGEAVSVWSVDTPVAKGLVERILKLPNMVSVNVIEL